MGNDHEANEAHDDGLTPRCGYCGHALIGMDSRAQYCTRRCKELAREKRRRDRERVDSYRAKYPDVAQSLLTFDDDQDQGQDAGPPGDDTDNRAWSDMWKLHAAIDAIEGHYARLIKPYTAQQRRNPGVRLPGIVVLERQRDDEIDALIRAYERADELGRAALYEPRRINEAHERQTNHEALQALANQLPGRARRTQAPNVGRATRDVWRWQ